jgi:hypothetical protein
MIYLRNIFHTRKYNADNLIYMVDNARSPSLGYENICYRLLTFPFLYLKLFSDKFFASLKSKLALSCVSALVLHKLEHTLR